MTLKSQVLFFNSIKYIHAFFTKKYTLLNYLPLKKEAEHKNSKEKPKDGSL